MLIVTPAVSILLLVGLITIPQDQQSNKPVSRSEALATLQGCATRPVTMGCSEDTADYLIRLYKRDKALLKPLLHAGLTSDGALSETLGDFYSNVLWKNPREFLKSLRSHSMSEQKNLCFLTAGTDGSGMAGQTLRDVRRNLRQVGSESSQLAPVARLCLREVERVNAKNK